DGAPPTVLTDHFGQIRAVDGGRRGGWRRVEQRALPADELDEPGQGVGRLDQYAGYQRRFGGVGGRHHDTGDPGAGGGHHGRQNAADRSNSAVQAEFTKNGRAFQRTGR